uniref:Uncharacterized protein n=1 Tax=Rhizophora mucronata TaxID=61149 RepID=A0A2P2IYJ8_RHIMU
MLQNGCMSNQNGYQTFSGFGNLCVIGVPQNSFKERIGISLMYFSPSLST